MADNNNTIKTTVELDVSKAQQDIVKLNSKASDSTKSLEERIEAKNKQIEIQNKLSKKTIDSLENERRTLEGRGASEEELMAIFEKINAEKSRAIKLNEDNEKSLKSLSIANKKTTDSIEGLSKANDESKTSVEKLDDATGGLITKFKNLSKNPIIIVASLLAGIFSALKEAVGRSSAASESFAKVGAKLSGIFNGMIAFLTPLVEILGETLVSAIEEPEKAWNSFTTALKDGYEFIKSQVLDRLSAGWTLTAGGVKIGILNMRIAWNKFTGDAKEAEKLTEELDKVKKSVVDATEVINKKNQEVVDLANDAIEAVTEFGAKAKEAYDKAAEASANLANAEKRLVINSIALEKTQLKSLRLAEEQRQIRDDTSKTIKERIDANTKLGKILDLQSKRELSLANQSLSIARAQKDATGDTIENIQAVGDAELKILEIRERITGQRSEQLVNEIGLLDEQKDNLKTLAEAEAEIQASIDEIRIQSIKDRGESALAEELVILERKRLQELENLELTELGKKEIEERFKKEKADLEKAEEEMKIEKEREKEDLLIETEALKIEKEKEDGEKTLERELELLERKRKQDVSEAKLTKEQISFINTQAEIAKDRLRKETKKAEIETNKAVLESALDAAGQAFGISQEVAVAKMLMNAPEAIGNVWSQAAKQPTLPQMFLHGAIGTLTTTAPIVKGLADIKNTRFSKKSSSGSSSGSISTSGGSSGSANALSQSDATNVGIESILSSNASADASNNILGGSKSNIVFSENRYEDFKSQVEFKENRSSL